MRFIALATVPPFVVNRASEVHYALTHYGRSLPETLRGEFLWATLTAFGLFVALPMALVALMGRLRRERPTR